MIDLCVILKLQIPADIGKRGKHETDSLDKNDKIPWYPCYHPDSDHSVLRQSDSILSDLSNWRVWCYDHTAVDCAIPEDTSSRFRHGQETYR